MTKLEKLIHDIDSTKSNTLNKREILLRLLEIDEKTNSEPTELRKEFENEIKAGDTVEVIYETLFSTLDKGYQFEVRQVVDNYVSHIKDGAETWTSKTSLKKI